MEEKFISETMLKFSVIIPVYNNLGSLTKLLDSIIEIEKYFDQEEFEIIFIDDVSTDLSMQYLKQNKKNNWTIKSTGVNSGSPSKPRNIGSSLARGRYIIFLDADDILVAKNIEQLICISDDFNYDILRTPLVKVFNENKTIMNTIDANCEDIRNEIFKKQSTVSTCLINREFFLSSGVQYHEKIFMGEDTLFFAELFSKTKKVGYSEIILFEYITTNSNITSQYNLELLEDHIFVWEKVEKILRQNLNMSYLHERGKIAFGIQLKYFYDLDFSCMPEELFFRMFKLYDKTNFTFDDKKIHELYLAIKACNQELFIKLTKKTLLIAGFDLKFILPYINGLEKKYNVILDKWSGHNLHDEKKSQKLLKQANIIFCEWMLGNSVWYSKNKLDHQKLIVRLHRFELTTDYITKIKIENIDKIIAVSYYFYQKIISTLDINYQKIEIINNGIEILDYQPREDLTNSICIVGILPKRKGLIQAVRLMKMLKNEERKFHLNIYGDQIQECEWLKDNIAEQEYYQMVTKFIEENKLAECVTYHGHKKMQDEFYKNDYVISVSDDEEIPESFHLGPAEAMSAGVVGLFLNWRGVEYLYPKHLIFDDLQAMRDYIVNNTKMSYFNESEYVKEFISANYNLDLKLNELIEVIRK